MVLGVFSVSSHSFALRVSAVKWSKITVHVVALGFLKKHYYFKICGLGEKNKVKWYRMVRLAYIFCFERFLGLEVVVLSIIIPTHAFLVC